MLDIKMVRNNPELVKENMRKKFQDNKVQLVDEVIELDIQRRDTTTEVDELRSSRNTISKQIGMLMGQGKKEEAEIVKQQVTANAKKLEELEKIKRTLDEKVNEIMMKIPNIIDDSVPIGKNDEDNVELEKYGEPIVPDYEIPYHIDIMKSFNGVDLESSAKVAGNGFYYFI